MSTALAVFSEATQRWFADHFREPTDVQREGWARIAAGEHTLMLAPTGSGKTLAAFLFCLDRLARAPAPATPGVRVLYISPIKALAYDIERNLQAPLVGIALAAEGAGLPFRVPGVDVRTGDTPTKMRRRQARRPGEILITTPESLYLLLGSNARETLRSVETVIVDEIHAFAGGKRGVHLALSLERLAEETGADPQRIGLSATQRPLEEVALFLGGDRPVAIVDASRPPALDLEVMVPVADMEAPAAVTEERGGPILAERPAADRRASLWPSVYPALLELIRAHKSTILFVNSRRLAERLSQQLNELAGEELVRAHHGSVSRQQRETLEEMLKAGQLRGLAATSSLELGIDMGAVDLVIQIESPGAVSRGLQRIGRAGHGVGETSRGRIVPKFRGDLLEAAVVARRMVEGAVEPLDVPRACLDVLSQQLVAHCAVAPRTVDELETLIRRTYSFRDLGRELLLETLEMLSGRYPSGELAELRPLLSWDRSANILSARRGAKMIALSNAGTIPDRGLFAVHLGEGGPRIGELDEEMVHEARRGETFLLGASTWRIEEITRDRVIVTPAPGEPGKMPFWRGDGPGRPVELGRALGAFVREVGAMEPAAQERHLRTHHCLDAHAAANLRRYIGEQREATGVLPSDKTLVIERFRDELGDWRVCLLSPFGARVHAPWALALQARLSSRFGQEVQTLWTDDGIALRFPDADELPGEGEILPDPDEVEELVVERLAGSALFASRFREAAGRALLLPKRRPGSRSPLWAQRLRAQNLLAVAQRFPSFPIVLETYRECMRDVFDLEALKEILGAIRSRAIAVESVETARPSPFARSLAYAYVAAYLYEGDAPLAERRAQALTLDRRLLRELLGQEDLRDLLDADAIEEVEAELQRTVKGRRARDRDELHDLLRRLGDLSVVELCERAEIDPEPALETLRRERRADRVRIAGDERWIALEDAGRYRDALGTVPPAGTPIAFLASEKEPLEVLFSRFARTRGPFTAADIGQRFGMTGAQARPALRALVAAETLLEGGFRPGGRGEEFCDPEVLRRLRRRTLAALRNEIAPVDAAALGRFLPQWQRIGASGRGLSALGGAVAQLEGLALPFGELEARLLPARIADFQPRMLDELGALGELVWIGRGSLGSRDGRVALYRRQRLRALLDSSDGELPESGDPELQRAILSHLETRGASFVGELETPIGAPMEAIVEAIWDLVWAGLVTNDTFAPLRALARPSRSRRGGRHYQSAAGRWSRVASLVGEASPTERAHARAEMLLERYGIVSRDAAVAESLPGGFADVGRVLRAMEESGAVRRGHFVDGLGGAQFAHAGAVDRLRDARSSAAERVLALAACDPANPYGALLPWPETAAGAPRPARRRGASVVLVDGLAVLFVERGGKTMLAFEGTQAEDLADAAAGLPVLAAGMRRRTLRLERVDGVPARESHLAPLLERAGFRGDYRGLVLEIPR